MHFKTKIPPKLKPFFQGELAKAASAFAKKNYIESWRHLERAHILGQPYPFAHTTVHWKMLRFAIRIKSTREIIGQIPRLMVGGIKSFVGRIPVGNTGGADVPALKPMEIPEDLALIIRQNNY